MGSGVNVAVPADRVYDAAGLAEALGVAPGQVAAACRAGALRCARVGTQRLFRAAWVLAWLEAVGGVPADGTDGGAASADSSADGGGGDGGPA